MGAKAGPTNQGNEQRGALPSTNSYNSRNKTSSNTHKAANKGSSGNKNKDSRRTTDKSRKELEETRRELQVLKGTLGNIAATAGSRNPPNSYGGAIKSGLLQPPSKPLPYRRDSPQHCWPEADSLSLLTPTPKCPCLPSCLPSCLLVIHDMDFLLARTCRRTSLGRACTWDKRDGCSKKQKEREKKSFFAPPTHFFHMVGGSRTRKTSNSSSNSNNSSNIF